MECVGDNLQTRGVTKTSMSQSVLMTTYRLDLSVTECVGDNLQTRGVTKTSMSQSVLMTTYRQAA